MVANTKLPLRPRQGDNLKPYQFTKASRQHGGYAVPPPNAGGGGRKKTLLLIDNILSEAGSQKRLAEELRKLFDADPILFWERFGLPLVPREMVMSISGGEANAITSMRLVFEVVNQKPGEAPTKS